jgi:ferredoxin-NADP reductase
MFREELAELKACNANLKVTVTMSRPAEESWPGAVGHIDAALLASSVPDIATRRAHICGPPSMMEAVRAALLRLGVPEGQITEAFGTVKRDLRVRGPVSSEIAGRVTFQASGSTAPIPVSATILDVADEAGIYIDNACRSGHVRILPCRAPVGQRADGRQGRTHRTG